jgi:hypothetical protein
MDIEEKIRQFAKARKVSPEDFPAFREKILVGLKGMGLSTTEIDLNKYKEVAKCQKQEEKQ